MKEACILSIMVVLVLIVVVCGNAAILRVPGEYNTIADAFNSSQVGDTVLVYPGDYNESIIIDHDLSLFGTYVFTHDSSEIHETQLIALTNSRILDIVGPDIRVSIEGILFGNGYLADEQEFGGAIRANQSELLLKNCIFTSNYAECGGAIYTDSSSVTVNNCQFSQNMAGYSGGAMHHSCGYNEIKNCVFAQNISGWIAGGITGVNSTSIVNDNVFKENRGLTFGGAINLGWEGQKATIKENVIVNNRSTFGGGIFISGMDSVWIESNYIAFNLADEGAEVNTGLGGGLVVIDSAAYYEIYKNNFYNNVSYSTGGAAVLGSTSLVYDNIIKNNKSRSAGAYVVKQVNDYEPHVESYNNLIIGNLREEEEPQYQYFGAIDARGYSQLMAYHNDIYGNRPRAAGFYIEDTLETVMNVTNNYWGHPSGPYQANQNPGGLGDTVSTLLDVIPFSSTPFTNFRNPVGPVLNHPNDGAINDTLPIRFTWEEATDPNPDDTIHYILELSLDEEFTDPDQYYFIPQPSRVVSWFDYENTYYWRVIAYDDVWLMDTSEVRELRVTSEGLPPRIFNLLSPQEDELILETPVTFTWSRALDFTIGDTVSYTLELAPIAQFDDPITYPVGMDTFFTVDESQFEWEETYRWRVVAEDIFGHRRFSSQMFDFFLTGVSETAKEGLPETWDLSAPYPNPFNARMAVIVSVPERGLVDVDVFDVLGRQVTRLHRGELTPGWHRIGWEANAPSGTYFVRAQSGHWSQVRKVLLLK